MKYKYSKPIKNMRYFTINGSDGSKEVLYEVTEQQAIQRLIDKQTMYKETFELIEAKFVERICVPTNSKL